LLEIFQQAQVLVGGEKSITIGEIDQVQVCGDRDRIKQVIWNLVGNAIKYTPSKGKIVLSLCKQDGMCMIQVADNGPGIPEEDLDHIFERFYRAEKSRSRHINEDEKGFGLGLSISYWIVKNHGGNIAVDSKLGHGTTFTVHLPMIVKCKEGTKGIIPASAGPERIG
jgi:signal transduction histidine kinase